MMPATLCKRWWTGRWCTFATAMRKASRMRLSRLFRLVEVTRFKFGMVLGISSLSCAWAGCYGAQQMAQMVTFFKETGVSLAPRFMAANHHHFIKGAGVAAIVAGLAIIVGGIIDIVESVKEKDALVQRTENIRADLCRFG